MQNLAAKYRPQELSDVVEQSVVIDIVKNICESDEVSNRNFLFIGPAGTGKALPNDEPVLTYDGFKPMGEVQVGDTVITHTGATAQVTGVFPQGVRPVYKIVLEDGASIRVSDNHLNVVTRMAEGEIIEEVVTTDFLPNQDYKDYSIPLADIDWHLNRLGLEDLRRESTFRRIASIKFCAELECTCIYVDHPDHTFISNDFITTHNTTTARIIATALNKGQGEPIEIDAASHSGVESVRAIIEQMRSYPVGCKYKVFIIDECFPGSTLVHTTQGLVPIENINPGTRVYNLTGEATVSRLLKNSVPVSNLVCLRIKDKRIVTTRDHLFFTDEGWVKAIDLKEGDVLYDYKTMQGMRYRDGSKLLQRSESVLQQGMQEQGSVADTCIDEREQTRLYLKGVSSLYESFLESQVRGQGDLRERVCKDFQGKISSLGEVERKTCEVLAIIYLSQLWQGDGNTARRSKGSVWVDLLGAEDGRAESHTGDAATCDQTVRKLWEYISSVLGRPISKNLQSSMPSCTDCMEEQNLTKRDLSNNVREDEGKQPRSQSRNPEANVRDEAQEWDIDPETCYAMWKRTFFQAADSFEERIRRGVEIRVCSEDRDIEEGQSASVPLRIQTRPRLTQTEVGSRGGWDRPQYEIATTLRRKESEMLGAIRLDSVESYQRGSNDELFQDYFPDTALCDAEYVTLYDLEVEGHPSYFVDDVLVHNCHSLSNQSWQVMLKTLEEQPARTIVALCTTNPEKIPATILSRVQTFQLSKISLDGIYNRLKYIIEEENKEGKNITYEDDAILFIAKTAGGGMRDGITSLDQCLSYSNDITMENVIKALDLPNYDDYFELLNSIARKDNEGIVKMINNVYNSGSNFVKWFDGFFSFITNIVKFIYIQDINQTMIPSTYQDKISKYGVKHSALCLKLSNKLVKLNQELKTSSYLQELAISYLCTPPNVQKG